ncbi:Dabb family protein [Gordonia terrae]|uniref:Dabb family protein n=2 Tax=Gordonia terrae TaxID=2055 RepID=A0AAD0K8S1_9ACTN|nr:Dabb family protein [Gordonia terrae]VTR09602.1 Stress responsive A/B Barrel Domain [Clostridioides difficile]ANY22213.1 stress responsive protein [Gordonia terrae]AWO82954.1 Dabb family protein [Gordonia terrae]VTS29813.1 Stress responsive A/B Barrel Domain [Gordonia terrae]GAB46319.1 hypothetical protein GOTRE_150_00610 [Gordonia terrae NBRC 100016]
MFKVTSLIHLSDASDHVSAARLTSDLRIAAGRSKVSRSVVERTLPGVRNGGDVLVHLQFERREDWNSSRSEFDHLLGHSAIHHVDQVEYFPGQTGTRRNAHGSVYRSLLLSVADGTDDEVVRRFEDETLRMPAHVRTMTSWQLSRVDNSRGSVPYTHVWEQEFTDLAGLTGPYLAHPVHWGYIDRWFDPECPEVIIRDRVAHSFCNLDAAVIEARATELTA